MKSRNLKLAAFIVGCVWCVVLAPYIIPLAWMIPFTVHIFKAWKHNRRIGPGFIFFATFLMLNIAIGVLLLYSENIYTRRRFIYYAALFETIVCGIFLYPLAYMIPFTVKYHHYSLGEKNPGIAPKILTIIFFGPLPFTLGILKGILYFTERRQEIEPVE